jgi:transposase-like protein DUF772
LALADTTRRVPIDPFTWPRAGGFIMVRRHEAQLSIDQLVLFGIVVPEPEALMDEVTRQVDLLLDDDTLVDLVLGVLRRRFPQSARRGRHGTPAEVVLRLLALKHLKQWSYAELEREVNGSLVHRRFCRIDGARCPMQRRWCGSGSSSMAR